MGLAKTRTVNQIEPLSGDPLSASDSTFITRRGPGDSAPDAGEEDGEEDDPGHVHDAPPPDPESVVGRHGLHVAVVSSLARASRRERPLQHWRRFIAGETFLYPTKTRNEG